MKKRGINTGAFHTIFIRSLTFNLYVLVQVSFEFRVSSLTKALIGAENSDFFVKFFSLFGVSIKLFLCELVGEFLNF